MGGRSLNITSGACKDTLLVEGGGVRQCEKVFLYFCCLFMSSVGLSNAYLVVFGLFLPKTEEKHKKKTSAENNF